MVVSIGEDKDEMAVAGITDLDGRELSEPNKVRGWTRRRKVFGVRSMGSQRVRR